MFRLKRIQRICRKYETDLWHTAFLTEKLTILNFSLIKKKLSQTDTLKKRTSSLRIDNLQPVRGRRRLSSFGKLLEIRKKICYTHGGLSKKQYRQLNRLALKMNGDFCANMLYLLESRFCMLVYRLGFAKNIFESIQLIFAGQVLINKKVVTNPNYIVPLNAVVELNYGIKKQKYQEVLLNIKKKQKLILQLPYHEINFFIMAGLTFRKPFFNEIPFSFSFSPEFFYSEYTGKL